MNAHSILVGSERGLAQRKAARSERLLAVLTLGLGLTLAVVWLLDVDLPVARAASFTVTTTANYGGGIYNEESTLALVNSTVGGNTATSDGGGLYNDNSTAVLTYTTIASNTAILAFNASGIWNAGGKVLL